MLWSDYIDLWSPEYYFWKILKNVYQMEWNLFLGRPTIILIFLVISIKMQKVIFGVIFTENFKKAHFWDEISSTISKSLEILLPRCRDQKILQRHARNIWYPNTMTAWRLEGKGYDASNGEGEIMCFFDFLASVEKSAMSKKSFFEF